MALVQVPGTVAASGVSAVHSRTLIAVEVKATWAGAWERVPYMVPVDAVWAAAPSIGRATFRYDYGSIKREDVYSFSQYDDLDLRGYYIRIVNVSSGGNVIWTGYIPGDAIMPHGGAVNAGRQQIEAYGLCHLLDREAISWAQAKCIGGSGVIRHAPAFNRRLAPQTRLENTRYVARGNRSSAVNADGVYEISEEGERWSAREAAEYILEYHTPDNGPTFSLGGQCAVLEQLYPIVEQEGRTPWQVLNELIDRRRGLGFVEWIIDDEVVLYVYSVLDEAMTLGGVTIPANAYPLELDLSTSVLLGDVELRRSNAARFDEIEVRGNRILVVGSFAVADATAEKGWPAAEETAYIAGGSDSYSGFSDLAKYEQADINDAVRAEDRFENIFTKLRVPAAWNGQLGDGVGGAQVVALPVCADDGQVSIASAAPFVRLDKHFEPVLPFEEGKDYTANPPTNRQAANTEPALLRPFALIKHPTNTEWYHVEKLNDTDLEEARAHLKIFPRELAVAIEGNPRHVYGLNHMSAVEDDENVMPVADYEDLIITAAFRTDQVLRYVATRPDLESGAEVKRLVIQIPDAEYWHVCANTVVGVGADLQLQTYGGPAPLRNDIARLQEVAAAALAWYGRERAQVVVPLKYYSWIMPGQLLTAAFTAATEYQINTAITAVRWQFDGAVQKTFVETAWTDLDWSVSLA